ncbi:DUF3168 domain-containing protein [Listeria monocytogenes]|uniref:DUF3168 domain-containing protein n=1 Tax=Listeria monocytogenes TaxID=1639 RepID=UPI001CD928D6|nr:DUF3168 domain-containing protein [Listeria monocytogenes]
MSTNPVIKNYCENRIKYYEGPETMDSSKPFMIIEPVDVELPAMFSSDEIVADDFFIQVSVEAPQRKIPKEIQAEVRKELRSIGLAQLANGLDEYFKDTKRYVDARRYRGVPFRLFLLEEEVK